MNDNEINKSLDKTTPCCPNTIEYFLILYLYSIEPPFYYWLNKAIKEQDYDDELTLEYLGPFARALHEVLFYGHISEKNKGLNSLSFGMDDVEESPYG